ncbi:MAG TPA: YajG family lipoprotein [Nitrospirota bacterium]|nr:YajG family lipoprotein [Nitrospirota bacterium]
MIALDTIRVKGWTAKTPLAVGWAAASLMAILLFSGCAEKGPILLHVEYQPSEGKAVVASKKIVVGLSPFKDDREAAASVLGTRTIPDGMQNDLVVEGTVADAVTSALKTALKDHGLDVKDVPSWDLTEEGMEAADAELLFGGEIQTLRLHSKATTFNTIVTASVQMRVVAGDIAEKKIIRTLDVSSKISQEILYSRDKLEKALSEALTSALDQIFQDDVLRKRLELR